MKKIYFLFFLLFLVSCGYEKTSSEDIHPEIPYFPKHSNSKIKVTPLDFYAEKIYELNNRYLAFGSKDKGKNPSKENLHYFLLDKNFEISKQLSPLFEFKNLNKLGEFYTVDYVQEEGLKPTHIPRKVTKKIIDDDKTAINLELWDFDYQSELSIKDSLFQENKIKDSARIENIAKTLYERQFEHKIIAEINQNLISAQPIGVDLYVLKFPDKEVAFFSFFFKDVRFHDLYENKISKNLKPISPIFPKIIDEIFFENKLISTGRLSSSFRQKGMRYAEIQLNNQTSSFKYKFDEITENAPETGIYQQSTDKIIFTHQYLLYRITAE